MLDRSLQQWPSVLLLCASCVGTRLVHLEQLDVPLPAPSHEAGWRSDMDGLIERYERAPVLAPDDEQLTPLFGGLTTLSYFGADAQSRARDQLLAPGAQGSSLDALCTGDPHPSPVGADLPAFQAVWTPLARHGGAADGGVSCNERGQPVGPGAAESFCLFARAALQPGGPHPLVVVVHGLFDSSAQYYVQHTAAVLFQLGYSVLLPDMRDHGDTLRAAPDLATTLGTLEGPDLLAVAEALRRQCAGRVDRLGLVGVSGGALDAIRAFTLDSAARFDAGVLALSPLLDVDRAIADLGHTGSCVVTRSLELSALDIALLTAAGGASTFAGAALARAVDGDRLDASVAIAAGVGAGVGLLGGLAVDAWFDGSSDACVSQHAIAQIVQDALRVRWRTLARGPFLSPAGRKRAADQVTLDDYLRERVEFVARRAQLPLRHFESGVLTQELRTALAAPERARARLLVLGADDDPMIRVAALRTFIERTRHLPQVYARSVEHGGHAALLLVQPTVMDAVFARFFAPD